MRCYVCGRKASKPACDRCWARGFNTLKDLPSYYYALEAFLVPAKGYGEKVQGTRTPPLPARLNVLHLRTGGISNKITFHEREIRSLQSHATITFRGDEGERIEASVRYLVNQWEWIVENYDPGILVDLDGLYGEIQGAIGNKSEDITIGSCPAEYDDGSPCGAILRVSQKILETMSDIRCPNCATVWESRKWRLLGQIIEQSSNDYYVESGVPAVQGVN